MRGSGYSVLRLGSGAGRWLRAARRGHGSPTGRRADPAVPGSDLWTAGRDEGLPLPNAERLRGIGELPAPLALREAAVLLVDLTEEPAFEESVVLPLVRQPLTRDWRVACRRDAEDGAYSVQVFVWPPGTATKIHDHSSWGAYRCVWGSVVEERYERLDDGSVPDHARLRRAWRRPWGPEDGASTVMPGDGGIHRVSNPGGGPAVSVHLYGPRPREADGRDYDPDRDYVCDRP